MECFDRPKKSSASFFVKYHNIYLKLHRLFSKFKSVSSQAQISGNSRFFSNQSNRHSLIPTEFQNDHLMALVQNWSGEKPCRNSAELNPSVSQLYFKDNQNQIFSVSFYTCHVQIKPVYLSNRNVPDFQTDKNCQCPSRQCFREECNFSYQRFWLTRRFFKLLKNSRQRSNNVAPSIGIRDSTPVYVYKKYPKRSRGLRQRHISASKDFSERSGSIMLMVDGINYTVKTHLFSLDNIKNRFMDHFGTKLNPDGCPISFNKAHLVAQYKKDVLFFKFDICNVSIQASLFKSNKGSQVKERYTFLPYFVKSSNRRVFVPIPMSTFDYTDPMVKIRQQNYNNAIQGFEPAWMHKVRHERKMKQNCEKEVHKFGSGAHIKEDTSSIMLPETGGLVYKLRAGLQSINELSSKQKYEEYCVERQRISNSKQLEKIRPITKNQMMPDWDLEIKQY